MALQNFAKYNLEIVYLKKAYRCGYKLWPEERTHTHMHKFVDKSDFKKPAAFK